MNRTTVGSCLAIALALLPIAANRAHAADGVLEINQTCAEQTGCFAGDTPGFPVTTQADRSYVLTSSLGIQVVDVTAIELGGGSTLDLNGWSIVGPAVCTGTPPSCVGLGTGVGSGFGVRGTGPQATIRNGRIAGMGATAIYAEDGTRVERMLIEANGGNGIFGAGGDAWQITDCRILRNTLDGIRFNTGGTNPGVIARNSIWGNTGDGIRVIRGLLTENASYKNGSEGFVGSTRAAFGSNAAFENNGGDVNPQISGTFDATAPNVCGGGACP
jgi:hypothetical protein